jgi:hypothetical protein
MAVNLSPVAGAAAQFFTNSGQVLTGGKLYTYLAGTTTPAVTYTSSSGSTAHPNPIVLNAAGRVPDSGEIWLTDAIAYKFVLKDQNDVLIATYDNLLGINSNFLNFTGQEETQIATQGQTVFTLATIQYTPAVNNLLIFVNGSKQIIGDNFIETSSTVITFVNGLNDGDVVDFCTAIPINTSVIDACQVAYDPPFIDSVPTSVCVKLAETVSIKDFGAIGNGVIDDTTAFENAVAAVDLLGGGTLLIPSGTYLINSVITSISNIHIIAYGATIIGQIDHTYSDNVIYEGLNIDNTTAPTLTGLSCYESTNFTYLNNKINSVLTSGIRAYKSDNVKITGNTITKVSRLNPANAAADGILLLGCTNCLINDNYVYDFKRIGIVSDKLVEGANTFYGENIIITNNNVSYAHDADETNPTSNEYNAGIWTEETDNIIITNNIISSISGNPGQSVPHWRLIGISVNYNTIAQGKVAIVCDNSISVGKDISNQIGVGIRFAGGNSYSNFTATENYIENVNTGVQCTDTAKDIILNNNSVRNLTVSSDQHGQFFHYANANGSVQNLCLDVPKCFNVTIVGGVKVGDFNFINSSAYNFTIDILKLTNIEGTLHIDPLQKVTNISISNSSINVGNLNNSKPQTLGDTANCKIQLNNCNFYAIAGWNLNGAFIGANNGMNISAVNCYFDGVQIDIFNGGVGVFSFSNCVFNNASYIEFSPAASSTVDLMLSNCNIQNLPAGPFLTGNVTANIGNLFVNNCVFRRVSGAADTPFLSYSATFFEPALSFLQSNVHKSTLLYNFTSGVTQANNLAI